MFLLSLGLIVQLIVLVSICLSHTTHDTTTYSTNTYVILSVLMLMLMCSLPCSLCLNMALAEIWLIWSAITSLTSVKDADVSTAATSHPMVDVCLLMTTRGLVVTL